MRILYLISLLFFMNMDAQTSLNGVVRYHETFKNMTGTQHTVSELYFNKDFSIYLGVEVPYEMDIEHQSGGKFGDIFSEISSQDMQLPYFYRKFNTKEVVYNDFTSLNEYIVQDDAIDLKWIIHKEKRYIGNYECTKATTAFRGRNYTAWFTSKIPVDYGPLKFHGLPGLILEIYDDQEIFSVYASDIQINSAAINIEHVIDNLNLKVELNYKEFLNQRCIDAIAFNKRLEAKMGRRAGRISEITVGGAENLEINKQECE